MLQFACQNPLLLQACLDGGPWDEIAFPRLAVGVSWVLKITFYFLDK
jgi:hypothetical protein